VSRPFSPVDAFCPGRGAAGVVGVEGERFARLGVGRRVEANRALLAVALGDRDGAAECGGLVGAAGAVEQWSHLGALGEAFRFDGPRAPGPNRLLRRAVADRGWARLGACAAAGGRLRPFRSGGVRNLIYEDVAGSRLDAASPIRSESGWWWS
jgi:hypothetical protein